MSTHVAQHWIGASPRNKIIQWSPRDSQSCAARGTGATVRVGWWAGRRVAFYLQHRDNLVALAVTSLAHDHLRLACRKEEALTGARTVNCQFSQVQLSRDWPIRDGTRYGICLRLTQKVTPSISKTIAIIMRRNKYPESVCEYMIQYSS